MKLITKEFLREIAPRANDKIIYDLQQYLNEYLIKYNVNTYLRVCHFIAQAAHETDGFKTLEEYASGSAYEGRKDLGNYSKGDGKLYKGRGIFQLTGRANYQTYGQKIGINLEARPELAQDPKVSVLTALEYWNSKKLSDLADQDDVLNITRRINGGTKGLEERRTYLERAKKIIPADIFKEEAPVIEKTVAPTKPKKTSKPAIISVAKIGDVSPYISDLQNMLINKGADIEADGNFGPKTEQAVKDFQEKNNLEITGTIDTNTLNLLMV